MEKTEEKEYFTGSGPLLGLYVSIDVEPSKSVSSVFNLTGAYVYVHDKSEYPADSSFFSLIEPGTEVSLKISPTITESEDALRSFKVHSRQCLFNDEKPTFWSTDYGFQNCIQLCKMNAILNKCKCVPHYYPNLGHYPVCSLMDVPCLKKYEREYRLSLRGLGKNIFDFFIDVFGAISIQMLTTRKRKLGHLISIVFKYFLCTADAENEIVCDCLPECSYISYTGLTETVYYKNMYVSGLHILRIMNFRKKIILFNLFGNSFVYFSYMLKLHKMYIRKKLHRE